MATVLFSFSHYLFAFAHVGKNNIHPLAPTVWALALFALGLRRRSGLLLYGAGVAAGLGFYTLFSARAALPIIILFVLSLPDRQRGLRDLWALGLGFVLTVAPIFAVSGTKVFTRMLNEAPGGYAQDISGPPGQRMLDNLAMNVPAFVYQSHIHHFVSGSPLDPYRACWRSWDWAWLWRDGGGQPTGCCSYGP